MKVKMIYAASTGYDNYMYVIIDEASKKCAVVDPVEADTILNAVKQEGLELTTILTTHHHWDHAGGNKKLVDALGPKLVVVGEERAEAVNKKVVDGEELKIGSLTVKCLHTPCHTKGHLCFYVTGQSSEAPAVFTGDTLFTAGCGHFFEGPPAQMYKALCGILASLPPQTNVYPGHEYTVNNLKFASTVEPANPDIAAFLDKSQKLRSRNEPTVPTTIQQERSYNPFMRVDEATVQKFTGQSDPVKAMGALREIKNKFKAK